MRPGPIVTLELTGAIAQMLFRDMSVVTTLSVG